LKNFIKTLFSRLTKKLEVFKKYFLRNKILKRARFKKVNKKGKKILIGKKNYRTKVFYTEFVDNCGDK
jgi:hypothetical protein